MFSGSREFRKILNTCTLVSRVWEVDVAWNLHPWEVSRPAARLSWCCLGGSGVNLSLVSWLPQCLQQRHTLLLYFGHLMEACSISLVLKACRLDWKEGNTFPAASPLLPRERQVHVPLQGERVRNVIVQTERAGHEAHNLEDTRKQLMAPML